MQVLNLVTARAWSIKENFMTLWDYRYAGVAQKHFDAWYGWARKSRFEPIKKVALTLKKHWPDIKTYFRHGITNAGVESINPMIQRIKYMSRGFRNRQRFHMAICFHCGGLDLYPERAKQNL